MSYSICCIQKLKMGDITGIQIHNRREKEFSNTNKDIDWTKSNLNLDLLSQDKKFKTVVLDRINSLNLKKTIRKDATVMCQCLLTSDPSFFEPMTRAEQIEFFKKGFKFIQNRYGKENMVSAIIHFDERTPHLHISFVPVTKDGRLSAKDLFGPKDLRQLQTDYNRYCQENGYDLERGQLDSGQKHLEMQDLKLKTQLIDLELNNKKIKKQELALAKKEKLLKDQAEDLKKKESALIKRLNAHQTSFSLIDDISIQNIKKEALTGRYKLTGAKDDLEAILLFAQKGVLYDQLQNEKKKLALEVKQLKKRIPSISNQLKSNSTETKNKELVLENENLKASLKQLQEQLLEYGFNIPETSQNRLNSLSR